MSLSMRYSTAGGYVLVPISRMYLDRVRHGRRAAVLLSVYHRLKKEKTASERRRSCVRALG